MNSRGWDCSVDTQRETSDVWLPMLPQHSRAWLLSLRTAWLVTASQDVQGSESNGKLRNGNKILEMQSSNSREVRLGRRGRLGSVTCAVICVAKQRMTVYARMLSPLFCSGEAHDLSTRLALLPL